MYPPVIMFSLKILIIEILTTVHLKGKIGMSMLTKSPCDAQKGKVWYKKAKTDIKFTSY